MTAFVLRRPSGMGVLRFVRADPRPPIHPAPVLRRTTHRLELPIELPLLLLVGVGGLVRRQRRRRSSSSNRLRL